jgi:TldD protein
MSNELDRNHARLKLGENPAPYFLSYTVKDLDQRWVAGRYGALFDDESSRDRRVYVDVRVGSHDFDSSTSEDMDFNFSLKGSSYTARKEAPLDDDATAFRAALWIITDERYKASLFNYLKKKGENVYVVEDPKRPAAFSYEQPSVYVQPPTLGARRALGVGAIQFRPSHFRCRRPRHRRQAGALLRLLGGEPHRQRGDAVRRARLRPHPCR